MGCTNIRILIYVIFKLHYIHINNTPSMQECNVSSLIPWASSPDLALKILIDGFVGLNLGPKFSFFCETEEEAAAPFFHSSSLTKIIVNGQTGLKKSWRNRVGSRHLSAHQWPDILGETDLKMWSGLIKYCGYVFFTQTWSPSCLTYVRHDYG